MEVFGFIAAVGSIGEVAYKFGTKISRVAKEAGTVGHRIERTSLLFITFATATTMAENSLEHRFPKLPDSSVTVYMQEKNLLQNMKRVTYLIQQDIQIREREIGEVTSRLTFITSWKWEKLEQRIISLLPLMECIKTNVSLVLDILGLETIAQMNAAKPSAEYEKEIEFLKTQIVEHINTIRHLRRSNREILKVLTPEAPKGSDRRRSQSPEADQLRVLCHLGQSLVETGAIPTQPPETFSFKNARRLRRYRLKQTASAKRQRNSAPLTIDIPNHEHRPRARSSSGPSPNRPVDPMNLTPQHSGETSASKAQNQADRDTSSKPRSMPAEPTPPSTPTSPAQPPRNTSSASSAQKKNLAAALALSGVSAQRPPPSVVHLDDPLNTSEFPIEPGYILHKNGTRADFEAHIDRQLARDQNHITLQYATELGAVIERHPTRTLVYRGVQIVSVGKVTLGWDTTAEDRKLLDTSSIDSTIEIIVCEDLPGGYRLIFGEWFANARGVPLKGGREAMVGWRGGR